MPAEILRLGGHRHVPGPRHERGENVIAPRQRSTGRFGDRPHSPPRRPALWSDRLVRTATETQTQLGHGSSPETAAWGAHPRSIGLGALTGFGEVGTFVEFYRCQ
jgi:hypothetical protein